jgi:hypothetical protein
LRLKEGEILKEPEEMDSAGLLAKQLLAGQLAGQLVGRQAVGQLVIQPHFDDQPKSP